MKPKPTPLSISRNLELNQRRTSVRLETPLWHAYDTICKEIGLSRNALARLIDSRRSPRTGLTSAVRILVVTYFASAAGREPRARTKEPLLFLVAALETIGPPLTNGAGALSDGAANTQALLRSSTRAVSAR